VYIEVPIEMTDEEIGCIDADIFDYVWERSEWEVDDSDGVCAEGFPEVLGPAPEGEQPDVIVTKDETGEFRAKPNEKFVI
jgi:hypothetical protein